MCQRLEDKEHDRPGAAQARFEADLEVRYWRVPGRPEPVAVEADEGAPYWWHGDEDASSSFLAAQGVAL